MRDSIQVREIFRRIGQKEVFVYCFWGATTTAVNILVYMGLKWIIDYRSANLAAILTGKVYAYLVNKRFVFKSICENWKMLLREIGAYVLTRGLTGIIDFVGVILLVEYMCIGKNTAKFFMAGIVIFANYFLGKRVVFLNRDRGRKNGVSFRKL